MIQLKVSRSAARARPLRQEARAPRRASTATRPLTEDRVQTLVNCIDNSGAAVVECVKVLRSKRPATIGDRIVVVVQKQRSFGPESGGGSVSVSAANKVRRGDIRHAVVVRTAKKIQRPDGSVVKFDDNACVLINKSGEPIGSRLNGIVGQELRKTKWSKILSLAPMHL
ncbi:54S ribosomal protein L38, mitochondrial [Diplodia seriata]|uniref:Large ribosomal subunit protein uL14m n=1 Tax=Diplodia seriata TaxID=420778 RepID=A0A1S8B7G8_9PEZI|nr:54S ribosomal protein L38, mitochondrial [Diplodia seriata]